jgi:V8-like Glu-specific endopeptidase
MRFFFSCVSLFALSSLVGCSVESVTTETSPRDDRAAQTIPANDTTTVPSKETKAEPIATAPADDGTHAEVVYVFMEDKLGQGWMCTGTLIAKNRVVTAAHCLESDKFVSWEIVAPLAPGRPRVSASNPKVFGGSFEDVANPDIGFLTLSKDITLPVYAQMTDVVAQVEAGTKVEATAVVRTDQTAESPLFTEDTMPVSSTVPFGYEHGFGTPMFSKGGDSGAGLFLVENGKVTHKLIGVARQPEPDRDLDHFTRIDAAFLAWYE